MNIMKEIRIEKLTLNIGAGKDQVQLEKGMALLKNLTGIDPVKTHARKRIPEWGLRPGLPIGCKLTIRKGTGKELLKRLLDAKGNVLRKSNFDDNGNISFGIHEYIDIAGIEYDPKIGVMGLQACVTLERPGFRIKRRARARAHLPKCHRITQQEAIGFMREQFGVKIGEEE